MKLITLLTAIISLLFIQIRADSEIGGESHVLSTASQPALLLGDTSDHQDSAKAKASSFIVADLNFATRTVLPGAAPFSRSRVSRQILLLSAVTARGPPYCV